MKMNSLSQKVSTVVMSNFIDETERHAELYGYHSQRQQMLLAVVEQVKSKSPDKEYIKDILNAINASVTEINWLRRTGHIYLG